MSTYTIVTLLHLWKQNKITTEQAMGYTLQQIEALTERQTDLEKRLRQLEQNRPDAPRKTQG